LAYAGARMRVDIGDHGQAALSTQGPQLYSRCRRRRSRR
jgi:hypothetical protein